MKKRKCFSIGNNIVIARFGNKRGLLPRFERYKNDPFVDGWTLRLGGTVIDYSPSGFGRVGSVIDMDEIKLSPWWKKW